MTYFYIKEVIVVEGFSSMIERAVRITIGSLASMSKGDDLKIQDKWYRFDVLLPWSREVYCWDHEKIQDDGMEVHGHTYGYEYKFLKWFFFIFGWYHDV